MTYTKKITIVVPLINEAESLPELTSWIAKVMEANEYSYEIIFVDDGSTDNSWETIKNLQAKNENIKAVKFRRNYGKSAALNTAFSRAIGEVVITMDADLQDSPDEIPGLYEMIINDGYDLVSGWKKKRYDNVLTKNLPSKLYNLSARMVSGIKLNDINCGLKAYKNEVVKNIEVYGDMHRCLPIMAKWEGFTKIGEKVVIHQARKYGKSKFGLSRFVNGFLDLMTVSFIGKFGKKPMHFFGTLGALMFFIGVIILLYLTVSKLFLDVQGIDDRPMFYLGILTVIVGVQLFIGGFLAELISRSRSDRNDYKISEEI